MVDWNEYEAVDSAYREMDKAMSKQDAELTTLRTELSASRAEVEALRGLVRLIVKETFAEDGSSSCGQRYLCSGSVVLRQDQCEVLTRATEPASRETSGSESFQKGK